MDYIRPRVRLTNYCNRKCTYCFAQDYIQGQKHKEHISLNDMQKILDMCEDSGIKTIAWQGGEPMIHENIIEIIEMHSKKNFAVSIFTNGLFESKIIDSLMQLDFYMLINLNAPDSYTKENDYDKVISTIKSLCEKGLGERIALGFNVYEKAPKYEFFLEVIKKFQIREVRVDLVRPSGLDSNEYIQLNEINTYFEAAKRFVIDCMSMGAYFTHFDCPFPICELTDENKLFLWRHSVNIERMGQCYTHIDIEKNLNIGSCFCSLTFENIHLTDFNSILECRNFIKHCEDEYRWNHLLKAECDECNLRTEKRCQGGCIGYNRKKKKIVINQNDLGAYRKKIYLPIDFCDFDSSKGYEDIFNISAEDEFHNYVNTHIVSDKLFSNLSEMKEQYELDAIVSVLERIISVPEGSAVCIINRFYAVYAMAVISKDLEKFDYVIEFCDAAIKMAPLYELCNLMRLKKEAERILL